MKPLLHAVLAAALVAAGAAQAALDNAAAEDLIKKDGCTACHSIDKKIVGPAYVDVAAKYKGDAGAAAKLDGEGEEGRLGRLGPGADAAEPAVSRTRTSRRSSPTSWRSRSKRHYVARDTALTRLERAQRRAHRSPRVGPLFDSARGGAGNLALVRAGECGAGIGAGAAAEGATPDNRSGKEDCPDATSDLESGRARVRRRSTEGAPARPASAPQSLR